MQIWPWQRDESHILPSQTSMETDGLILGSGMQYLAENVLTDNAVIAGVLLSRK